MECMMIKKKCLIIEDEEIIYTHLPSERKSQFYQLITYGGSAFSWLHAAPWRLVSHDIRLPEKSGDLLNGKAGIRFLEYPRPLTRQLVYTGFRTSEEGLSAADFGGKHDFWVIAKGARNEVNGRTAIASPLGWVALMRHLLGEPQPDGPLRQEAQDFLDDLQKVKPTATEPWHRAYWRIAPHHLPQPLAEAAARYAAACADPTRPATSDVTVDRNGLLALNDFREWSLWLAAAQTAVILRQSRPLERAPNREGTGAAAAHAWLTQQLRALHTLARTHPEVPGATAWSNYLGITEQPGVSGRNAVWYSVALDAMEELRRSRNQGVHGLKRHAFAEADLPLPALMDLASHWANNPLLSQVRREQGRWRAKAMCGKDWIDRDLPAELDDQPVDAGHVYQLVWRFPAGDLSAQDPLDRLGTPKPALLDWWPYLRWELNRDSGQRECVLLTQPRDSHDDSRWHAQGFSGTNRLLTLSTPERAALTRPVG